MKINALLLSLPLLLCGCQSGAAVPIASRPAEASPTPAAPPPPPPRVRAPEVVKTYTIGAYVDPNDPTLRHEAHTVQRIEAAAYWDLRPLAAADATPSVIPETAQPKSVASLPTPRPVAPMALPAPELTVDPEPALMPNGDGLIDLASAGRPASEEVNPFAVRTTTSVPTRTIELRVTGILSGAKPCAIINGQLIELGGIVEGLVLRHIEPGGVVLTLGRHRLRVPLSAGPVRILTAP